MAKRAENSGKNRLVVGISGASGVAYAIRLLEALKDKRADARRVMRKSKLRWRANREQLLELVTMWYDSADH